MSKASNYYYEQLNKEQQKAYYAMKEGLLNQQDSFAVPMLDKKELSDIYFMVRRDWMKRGKSCLSMILSYKMCGMTN